MWVLLSLTVLELRSPLLLLKSKACLSIYNIYRYYISIYIISPLRSFAVLFFSVFNYVSVGRVPTQMVRPEVWGAKFSCRRGKHGLLSACGCDPATPRFPVPSSVVQTQPDDAGQLRAEVCKPLLTTTPTRQATDKLGAAQCGSQHSVH